jgi:hypothetical protein
MEEETEMSTSSPGPRLALATFGVVMIIVSACTSAASPSPTATDTPTVAPSVTVAPTEAPTSTPAATPAATPTCSVSTDVDPAIDVTFYLSGTGFEPGVDIELTFVDRGETSTWGGPDGLVKPELLHTTPEGDFGPYDIMYMNDSLPGEYSITASDGSCEATVSFTIEAPAAT